MGSISRVHTFASGAVLTAAQLNNEFDNLLTSSAINGGLDASNLGVTAGQVTASKALVVDSSRDLDDTSASNQLNNLTVSGLLKTDNTPNATSTTDGSLQTDGGLSVALDAIIGDDLKLLSDSAVLSLGAGSDFTITHDGTTGATLAGNPIVLDSGDALTLDAHTGVFTFKDAGSSVLSITESNSGDVTVKLITNGKDLKFTDNGDAVGLTVLDGAAGITVAGEGDFGSLDVNGNADISGDLTLSAGADGALRFSAASSIKILDNSAASLVVEEADNAYMTFVTTNSSEAVKFDKALDINAAMDIDAAMQIDGTVTVGIDDTGYDVKFFGATSGSSVLIDESADDVIFTNFGLAVGSDATGDIYYRNSSGYLARLAAGSNGHVLTLDSGIPSWAAASGGDITGSLGSTDNAVPRANGTGGATLQASSVIIDDSNNITGVGNLTLSGEVDAATGDFSGAVDIAGDLTLSAGADGALRFSAASSVKMLDNSATSLVFEEADNAYMTFVTTNSSEAIKFDKSLDINASMDVDADVDISGDLTLSAGADGALRFSAASSIKILDNSATSLVVEEADNAYMTFVTTNSSEAIKFDVGLDVNAAVQIDSTVTVGVDDTGHDVKFFGATSGSSVLFDESADDMILTNYGLAVGSDATGDIYYRNSSGYLARLGAGTNGHFLKQGSSIPEWSAVSAGATLTGSTATTIPTVTGANAIAGEANLRYDDKILSTDGAAASFDTTFTGVQSEKMFIGGEDGHATNSEWWSNAYYDSAAYKRIGTGEASRYRQQSGTHTWYAAGSASADAAITWTTLSYWDSSGNVDFYASGGTAFNVGTSTPRKPSGGDWTASSDSRLKNVVGEYTLGLTELCNSNVRPIKYQYNGKADTTADGKTYVGLIAQEVEQVFSDTVIQYSAKMNESDENETTDLRMFDAGEIKWALVNAVKELKAELDSAKARITALEA